MQFPSRKARVALLAGVATFGVAGTASASTADYNTATDALAITVTGADTLDKLECVGGFVQFNGADPLRDGAPPAQQTGCAASASLTVTEADNTQANTNKNVVDLRGVLRKDWLGLAAANATPVINLGGGDDTVWGTEFGDAITPGRNADEVHGFGGNDSIVWNQGEGSDVMDGDLGVDTVVDNGGTGDETFDIKPKAGDATRVDVSRTSAGAFTLDIEVEKLQLNLNDGNDVVTGQTGVAGLVVPTISGGNGNDSLGGTDAGDTLDGGAGNDTIVGARGNDRMIGGEGDDAMIWNPGEGSDTMDGDAGNDTAVDNGGAGNEHFIVTAQGQRVTATRDNAAPFFLDIATTETLDLNTNAGDDTVEVNGGLGALIKVDANLGDGNDTIKAQNGAVDVIDGAAGTDTATTDANDQVTNVENGGGGAAKKVAFVSKKLKVKGGKAKLRITCPAGGVACKGNAAILRGKKVVGRIAIDMQPGQTKIYRIQLNRNTRVKLAKDADKKLAATARVRYAAGGKTITSKKALKIVG